MSKFFQEFKKFITRGNVIDMAVGVIVGSSFTAIVNALSNNILKPIINWVLRMLLGADTLSEVYTPLGGWVYDETGAIDLANSIYIDWGAFINAIINFFIVAFVLFTIVKIINNVREKQDKLEARLKKGKPTRAQKKEMKKLGIKLRDKKAVKAYLDEVARLAELAKKEAEEKAKREKEENPPAEKLLKDILAHLRTTLVVEPKKPEGEAKAEGEAKEEPKKDEEKKETPTEAKPEEKK